jgi:multidrug transporter EmrE-like cation transporter
MNNDAIHNNFWILMTLIIAVELIADILLKKWSINSNPYLLWAGVLIYSLSIYYWAWTLKLKDLIVSYGLYSILSSIGVCIIGKFMFNETLNINTIIGICLGLCGIYFLNK